MDFVLTKETKLTEHTSLEFEVQAFNILNHVQLGDPGTLGFAYVDTTVAGQKGSLLPDGGFGIISSTVKLQQQQRRFARHRLAAAASIHASLQVLTFGER